MFYSKLSLSEKINYHKKKLDNDKSIDNIIYAQASTVCIRNIKQTKAHQYNKKNIHLFYSGNSPNDFYGYGNQFYSSITKVHKKIHLNWKRKLIKVIDNYKVDIIHTHNEPDLMPMKIMQYDLGLPIIYDQHDFLSGKRSLNKILSSHEKYCNEKNDGAIFITDRYKSLVEKKYKINDLNICFPNYGSKDMILKKDEMYPKISSSTNKIHLVYVGALDQDNPNITRYLLPQMRQLSKQGFVIDIFPSKNDSYEKYKEINNVNIMDTQNPKSLIKIISKYDCGLTLVNPNADNMPEELKYGFWNKTFDYLMAGIPQITINIFSVISDFISKNNFGISVESLDQLEKNHSNLLKKFKPMEKNILQKNELYTYEKKIDSLYTFYDRVYKKFHQNRLNQLTK